MTGKNGGECGAPSSGRRGEASSRAATLRIIERHSAQVMRTARRYAATVEDAEDAYQRGIEIMLTKAPDVPDAELLPWLKTVVRHEAFALRRANDQVRLGTPESVDALLTGDDDAAAGSTTPGEQVERFERLRIGAEALRGLKPQEAKALALLAKGYSYSQICEETGWTYTKVNRCLAEGRQSFVKRVAGIESGAECERLAPKLSALADGEAVASEIDTLRLHLRRCPACRTILREQYLAPAAVAALLPLVPQLRLWPFERLSELVSALKIKLYSVPRILGLDPAAASTGSHGAGSMGLAKGLTLLCVGGLGVGGAAAGVELLEAAAPEQARASGGQNHRDLTRGSTLDSPDPRVVAERFRASSERPLRRPSPARPPRGRRSPDRPPRAGGVGAPSRPPGTRPGPSRNHSPERSRHTSQADRSKSPPVQSYQTESSEAPVDCNEYRPGTGPPDDDEYGPGARPPDDNEYGPGARPPPGDEYPAAGAPPPDCDEYGSGSVPPESDEHLGEGVGVEGAD